MLIQSLSDTELVAHVAIRTLATIGAPAGEAIPALLKIFEAEDGALRGDAACALAEIGAQSAPFVSGLRRALREAEPGCDIRVEAAWALGCIGPKAEAALKDLQRAAKADDVNVRLHATLALAQVDGRTEDALRTFAKALPALLGSAHLRRRDDDDLDVYAFVAEALPRLGPAALRPLEKDLGDANQPHRIFAAWALGQLGAQGSAALPALRAVLHDRDRLLRVLAGTAVFLIGGAAEEVTAVLVKVLQNIGANGRAVPNDNAGRRANPLTIFRISIPRLLATMGRSAVPALVQALPHLQEDMREEIVRILGETALVSADAHRDLEATMASNQAVAAAIRQVLDHRARLQDNARKERLRGLTFPPPLPPVQAAESREPLARMVRELVEALGRS